MTVPSIIMQGVMPVDDKENPCVDLTEGNGLCYPWKEASQCSETFSLDSDEDKNKDNIVNVKGEPVIMTGTDVSCFLVDVWDDSDPALTFRLLSIGMIFACLGAALGQVWVFRNFQQWHCCLFSLQQIYVFKPVQASVSNVFLLLLIHSVGVAWSKILPWRESVERTAYANFGPVLGFINPGKFRIKEVSWI